MAFRVIPSSPKIEATTSVASLRATITVGKASLADIFTKTISGNRSLSDTFTLSELSVIEVQKPVDDVLGVTDSPAWILVRSVDNSESVLGVTDTVSKVTQYNRDFADYFTLDEVFEKYRTVGIDKTNVFGVSDDTSWAFTRSLDDVQSVTDSYTQAIGMQVAPDLLGVTDTVAISTGTDIVDLVGVSDLIDINIISASSVINAKAFNIAMLNS